MALIEWTGDLSIGIDLIDGRHRRFVDCINQLAGVADNSDRRVVGRVISDSVDHRFFHFAFEETLLEEAGYDSLSIHQHTHEAFRRRTQDFKQGFEAGEAVAEPLAELLRTWSTSQRQD